MEGDFFPLGETFQNGKEKYKKYIHCSGICLILLWYDGTKYSPSEAVS